MGVKKKLAIIDSEPYYPAEKFEEEVDLLMKCVHRANIFAAVALALSVVSISLAILL